MLEKTSLKNTKTKKDVFILMKSKFKLLKLKTLHIVVNLVAKCPIKSYC